MLGFLTPTLPSLPLPRVIPMTPVGPCLPGHRSVRPYTVFELEQVRQQSRKYGGAAGSCEGFAGGLEGCFFVLSKPLSQAGTVSLDLGGGSDLPQL